MPLEIRSDIPLPSARTLRRDFNGPWNEMAVGDSFFMKRAASAQGGCYQRNQREGGKRYTFEARTELVDGKPVDGARVWRTA